MPVAATFALGPEAVNPSGYWRTFRRMERLSLRLRGFTSLGSRCGDAILGRAHMIAAAPLALLLATGALAQEVAREHGPLSAEDVQKALDLKRQSLQQTEDKAKTLEGDVAGLDAERERINGRLVETAALIQKSEAQMTAIEDRMSELRAQEKLVRGSLNERQGQIATLLSALQRMGRNPPPVLITRREDALKMVRSAMLLSSAFPELKDKALALATRLDDLTRVMTEIQTEGDRLKTETERLKAARTRLASLMEAKKLSIADRQSELQAVRTASVELSKNVSDLSELIIKLDRTVAEKTGLGAYEQERRHAPILLTPPAANSNIGAETAAAVAAAPVAAGSNAAATASAHETDVAILAPAMPKPQAIELVPSEAAAISANPGRIKPAIPFELAHAKLPLPAQGRRVLSFNEATQYGGQSKGLVLETRHYAQVVSPCDGWVVYAGEFRSYGQLLIINAGDGYHVLLAGMSQIDVQPGQFVLTAEPVGTMSSGAERATETADAGAPVLYVEFRKDGRPINPDPWWIASQQKVQG